jgi:xanthine dehydrogenase accessory factor
MARLAGYAVTLIDPRGAFANETRFPGVEIAADWPEEALAALRPDRRTAIVTLAHDPKLDDPALTAALRSEAFYIGALGSPRTHERRLGRLAELGFTTADLTRIHGPVGLDLGGRGAVEIAISILAQMTLVRHRGRGTS